MQVNAREFDFGSGKVVYFSFDGVDSRIPLAGQAEWELKEDLILVEFGARVVVDVGWYPSFDPAGSFTVTTVVDGDWNDPVVKIQCATIPDLKAALSRAVAAAEAAMKFSGCSTKPGSA